jgi:hypothetical protein
VVEESVDVVNVAATYTSSIEKLTQPDLELGVQLVCAKAGGDRTELDKIAGHQHHNVHCGRFPVPDGKSLRSPTKYDATAAATSSPSSGDRNWCHSTRGGHDIGLGPGRQHRSGGHGGLADRRIGQ